MLRVAMGRSVKILPMWYMVLLAWLAARDEIRLVVASSGATILS